MSLPEPVGPWGRLANSPDLREFFASEEVTEMERQAQLALSRDEESLARIGRARGVIEAIQKLRDLAPRLAKLEAERARRDAEQIYEESREGKLHAVERIVRTSSGSAESR